MEEALNDSCLAEALLHFLRAVTDSHIRADHFDAFVGPDEFWWVKLTAI